MSTKYLHDLCMLPNLEHDEYIKTYGVSKEMFLHRNIQTLSDYKLLNVKLDVKYNGNTLLYTACYYGNIEVVKILLQYGLDPNVKSSGSTNLYIATWRNHANVIDELLKYNALINEPNDNTDGAPPLCYAVIQNNIECLELLLKKGADLNYMPMYKSYYGYNDIKSMSVCLYYAILNNNMIIVSKILEKEPKVINMICNKQTPLHVACYNANVDIASFLIKKGANVSAVNSTNDTPLDISVTGGYHLIVELLIKQNVIFDYQKLNQFLINIISNPSIYNQNPSGYNHIALIFQEYKKKFSKKLNPTAISWEPVGM